jgi:hypothetical protein
MPIVSGLNLDPRHASSTRQVVVLRAILLTACLIVAGIFLLLLSPVPPDPWKTLLAGVAVALVTTGVVALGYELWFRRQTLNETLALVGLSRELHRSGITTTTKYIDIPWGEFPCDDGEIEIFVTYARTFASTYAGRFTEHIGRTRQVLRVIMLDPDGPEVLHAAYAHAFAVTADDLRRRMTEALDIWRDAATAAGVQSLMIIEGISTLLPFTYYRCGDDMWLVLNVIAHGRVGQHLPAILVSRTGTEAGLFDWVMQDLGTARSQHLLRTI